MGSSELRSDQLAPHNIEAEEAVLGAILIHSDALLDLLPFLRADDFFIVRHSWIWEAMIELHTRRDPIDYLTVVNELEQMERLAEIGGAAYILSLVNKTPSALNAEGYGRIVERTSLRRQYIDAAGQIARVAHSDETDIDEVVNKAESAVLGIADRRVKSSDSVTFEVARLSELERFQFALNNKDYEAGLKTYIPSIDNIFGVMPFGEVSDFVARPGGMKTGLLFQIALENAIHGNRIGVFSIEMSTGQFVQRAGANLTGLPFNLIENPRRLSEDQKRTYAKFLVDTKRNYPLHIVDSRPINTQQIRSQVRRWLYDYGDLKGICIDYMQLVSPGWKSRNQGDHSFGVGQVAKDLKAIAKEFGIAVICAVQASRKADERDGIIKKMDTIAGSKVIEDEAYKIASLNRPNWEENPNQIIIHYMKNRGGSPGTVECYVNPEAIRIDSLVNQHTTHSINSGGRS